MEHSQEPATLAPDNLADYISIADWLDRHAGAFFDTRCALDWFVKRNRLERKKQTMPGFR
jgi:hypothetical protein